MFYERADYLVSFFIVVSEERIKGSKLSPSKAQLTFRMLEETANICSNLKKKMDHHQTKVNRVDLRNTLYYLETTLYGGPKLENKIGRTDKLTDCNN